MGSHGRKQYTADFKRDAVALVTQQGYSVAEAAKNLGVNAGLLRRWKTEMERTGHGRLSGERPPNARSGGTASPAGGESAAPDGTGYFKKSHGLLRERAAMRYAFIHRRSGEYPLTVLCQVLQVSRSGYYAFLKGRPDGPGPRDAGSGAPSTCRVSSHLRTTALVPGLASRRGFCGPVAHPDPDAAGRGERETEACPGCPAPRIAAMASRWRPIA